MSAVPHLIIDAGSLNTRIGVSNTGYTCIETFPTKINMHKLDGHELPGTPLYRYGASDNTTSGKKHSFIGSSDGSLVSAKVGEYQAPKSIFDEGGDYIDFNEASWFWYWSLQQLGQRGEDVPILITESPFLPPSDRSRVVEVMLEEFHTPSITLADTGALSLLSTGRTTGVVLDCGHRCAYAGVMKNGVLQRETLQKSAVGGKKVNNHIINVLTEKGYRFHTEFERAMASDIKESVGYVSLDVEVEEAREADGSLEMEFDTGLGETMVITEGYKFGEALFQPSLMGQDGAKGAHELIHSSLQEVDAADGSLFETCLQNIVTAGGSTAFKNFNERVQLELSNPWLSNGCRHSLDPDLVKIWSPPILNQAAFSGAEALLANRHLYDLYTVTKAEYEEHGSHFLNKKLGLL